MKLNSSNHNPSVAERELSTVDCPLSTVDCSLSANLAPTAQEVALLTAQYHKALDGLYEAYKFGQMLLRVRERLEALTPVNGEVRSDSAGAMSTRRTVNGDAAEGPESDPHGSPENQGSLGGAARGTAGRSFDEMHGWNAGMGLKGWLAEHCPEINYSTARRFLAIAEKTHAALSSGDSPVDCSLSTVDSAAEPCEQAVRAYLEGKSQRAVLRLGGKREGAGRKPKDWAAALGTSPEVAMKRLEEALVPLNELIVVKALHRLLAPADLETVRGAIDLLRERIWENA